MEGGEDIVVFLWLWLWLLGWLLVMGRAGGIVLECCMQVS